MQIDVCSHFDTMVTEDVCHPGLALIANQGPSRPGDLGEITHKPINRLVGFPAMSLHGRPPRDNECPVNPASVTGGIAKEQDWFSVDPLSKPALLMVVNFR